MRTLYILGSSHANRIYQAAQKNGNLLKNFKLKAIVKSGAKISDLPVDDLKQINANDVLLIQTFGNEIIKPYIFIERTGKGKTIHLKKFEPINQSKIQDSYAYLQHLLSTTAKCEVFIIDNPIRHLNCCKKHRFSDLASFQRKQNKILKTVFKEQTVINHETLIFNQKERRQSGYTKLFSDTVHFKNRHYEKMIETFCKRYLKI